MNKKYFNAAFMCCLFFFPGTICLAQVKGKESVADNTDLHLYLLIGQSNMAGRASYGAEDSKPLDRCYLLNSNNQWEPAKNPLNRFSTIRKGIGMQKLNPGYTFATTMLQKQKNISIGLIVNAKGGTKIEQWAKGTQFYQEAVKRTRFAMKSGLLKGVLWHQGEGNSSKPQKYLPQLKKLIADLRKDLASPELPFVAGQLVGKEKINDQIAKLPKLVPQTGVATSDGLKAFDRWHFDTPSMKTLGSRYADAMLEIYSSQKKTVPKKTDAPKSAVEAGTKNPNANSSIAIQQPAENRLNKVTSASRLTSDAFATRKNFNVAGHRAFLMIPPNLPKTGKIPWVWYAPTLGKHLPGSAEKWMFNQFHDAKIAIAGIDVGESYGSPQGRAIFQSFFEQLTVEHGFSPKPVLLARSRGGLMLYSWAVEHPQSVGGIAGIYPVCNIASYPGTDKAASAFKMTPQQLEKNLTAHNPIDRLEPLAKHKVPIFHLHGDRDQVVPLKANSAIVETQYKKFSGPVEIEVVKGQGHNMWQGWFNSQKLVKFVIENAKRK